MNAKSMGLLAFSLVLWVTGCISTRHDAGESSVEEVAAAQRVLSQISNALGDAYPTGAAQFEMGPLDGGFAVLLREVNGDPIEAAFWNLGETVYAVNNAARRLNKALPDAPEAVTVERIRKVVH